MQRQAAAIFARVDADQRAHDDAYAMGHADGFQDGIRWGELDEYTRWAWALGLARKCNLMLTHAELVRRRCG